MWIYLSFSQLYPYFTLRVILLFYTEFTRIEHHMSQKCFLSQGLNHDQKKLWQSLPFSPAFPLAQREELSCCRAVLMNTDETQETREGVRVEVEEEWSGWGGGGNWIVQERRIRRHILSTKVINATRIFSWIFNFIGHRLIFICCLITPPKLADNTSILFWHIFHSI